MTTGIILTGLTWEEFSTTETSTENGTDPIAGTENVIVINSSSPLLQ